MKRFAKRCASALIAGASMLSLAVPAYAAETKDERRLPSGIQYGDLAHQFDRILNMDTSDTAGNYAGYEAIVFCGDEILFEGYFGETDRENGISCSEESVFEWGSITKTTIWVSAMQLWEQGRLDLDADIRGYLPEGFLRHLSYDAPITMMQIMDHTGGWCENTFGFSTPDQDKIKPLAQVLQETEPAQVNPPGEVVSYSNWGAALGAYVIECITGMDYADYVHKNIFEPLGMEHTSIAADFSDNEWVRTKRGELKSYHFNMFGYKCDGPKISYIQLYPAGSVAGTIRDLARYAQALASKDAPLFRDPATQEKMFSGSLFYGDSDIPISSYGFASDERKVRVNGHNGATIACASNMLFDRESGTGLVTFSNETSANLVQQEIPKLIFGTGDASAYLSGEPERQPLSGYFLVSRSQRAGLLKFTSCLDPVNAESAPDLLRISEGFYVNVIEGSDTLLSASRRTDGTESYIIGAMEMDKDSAYPVEISLLTMYFMTAVGALFLLLYKHKAARKGKYHITAAGAAFTASHIIKLLSVAAAFVMIAYVGREETYGLPRPVGVTAGIINLCCIVICALAAAAAAAGIISKQHGKWMKAGYGVTLAANVLTIAAVTYFEMFKFWGC